MYYDNTHKETISLAVRKWPYGTGMPHVIWSSWQNQRNGASNNNCQEQAKDLWNMCLKKTGIIQVNFIISLAQHFKTILQEVLSLTNLTKFMNWVTFFSWWDGAMLILMSLLKREKGNPPWVTLHLYPPPAALDRHLLPQIAVRSQWCWNYQDDLLIDDGKSSALIPIATDPATTWLRMKHNKNVRFGNDDASNCNDCIIVTLIMLAAQRCWMPDMDAVSTP